MRLVVTLENEIKRSRHPSRLPVYKHLSRMLILIGLGNIAFRASHPIWGALLLLAAAVFLGLAVRWGVVRRRQRHRPRA